MDVICQCMEVRSSTEDSTQSRLSQLSGCSFNVDSRRSSVLDVSVLIPCIFTKPSDLKWTDASASEFVL